MNLALRFAARELRSGVKGFRIFLACLALGVCVRPIAILLMLVYATGIALLHAHEGWFVVGAGRNGSEYSVLLIASLALIAAAIRDPLWRPRARER